MGKKNVNLIISRDVVQQCNRPLYQFSPQEPKKSPATGGAFSAAAGWPLDFTLCWATLALSVLGAFLVYLAKNNFDGAHMALLFSGGGLLQELLCRVEASRRKMCIFYNVVLTKVGPGEGRCHLSAVNIFVFGRINGKCSKCAYG